MSENVFQKLVEALKERCSCKFRLEGTSWRRYDDYPVKTSDGRELGTMIGGGNLERIYFEWKGSIKWPDDWIDPYPPFIDYLYFNSKENIIEVAARGGVNLEFMGKMYYAVWVPSILHPQLLERRKDVMKLARFVPAVVKDLCVYSKISNEVLTKYNVDMSEVRVSETFLNCRMKFSVAGMSDDEIIENTLRRVEILSELKRRWEEWLPNDERRECYESTIVCPEDYPTRYRVYGGWHSGIRRPGLYEGVPLLRKYPLESGNLERDKRGEKSVKLCLWDGFKVYNLDGYRLRLAIKTERGVELLGKPDRKGRIVLNEKGILKEEDLDKETLVIVVDKRMKRLPKIPLEKMQFLREEFPEMFATDSEE